MSVVCYCSNSGFIERHSELLHVSDMDALEKSLLDDTTGVLIVDVAMIKTKEDAFFEYIKNAFEDINIFCLSSSPHFTEGSHLLTYGIKGYGNLHMAKIHMDDAIAVIKNSEVWLYPEFLQQMIKSFTKSTISSTSIDTEKLETLSAREQEIASLVKQGFSNHEIAEMTGITQRTVKAHVSSIYSKLHVRDRISLVIKLR